MTSIYHPGELAVQARAGVREMASRIGKSIRSTIPLAAQEFLRSQPFAIVGSQDAKGRVWASAVTGEPGFIQAVDERTVRINARPVLSDPLNGNLLAGDQVGILVIEFATRRRMRLNGRVEVQSDGAIYVHANQVYANCPKYIQARRWESKDVQPPAASRGQRGLKLTRQQKQWIERADTFFIASSHAGGGADASHRGGKSGFVRVLNENLLVWPDYSGNTMFQTLGNIAMNPKAGLLFIDFENGDSLQLTGSAQIIWDAERVAQFPGAERLAEFQIDESVETTNAFPLRGHLVSNSPFKP